MDQDKIEGAAPKSEEQQNLEAFNYINQVLREEGVSQNVHIYPTEFAPAGSKVWLVGENEGNEAVVTLDNSEGSIKFRLSKKGVTSVEVSQTANTFLGEMKLEKKIGDGVNPIGNKERIIFQDSLAIDKTLASLVADEVQDRIGKYPQRTFGPKSKSPLKTT